LNRVGPYHNPHEQYHFYSLPLCRPAGKLEPATRFGGLADMFGELENSNLDVRFKKDVARAKICTTKLDAAGAQLLSYAVSNHCARARRAGDARAARARARGQRPSRALCLPPPPPLPDWYEMYLDELPVWAMVGEVVADEDVIREIEAHTEKPHGIADATYLYVHKNVTVLYNGAQVIEVHLASEDAKPIEEGKSYDLSFSVTWVPTDKAFSARFARYLDNSFFEHQIHWFSLFNSFMMVVFLCGLVALILMRTLRADYAHYMHEDDEEGGGVDRVSGDESGWKQVYGDVFRRPAHVVLYSALIGTGTQLALLALVVIGAAYGISKLASAAYEGMSRQPEVAGSIQTAMIIAAALIEGFTFYALFICSQKA
jgi:transmembrane 9 superfamily protein 3